MVSWGVDGTICRITAGLRASFTVTSGFLNKATSSLKRVAGRIFKISK
jgi:hypothetical protein